MTATSARTIVSFDLDGTLVDSTVDIARALNAALRDFALRDLSVDHVRRMIGEGAKSLIDRAIGDAGGDPAITKGEDVLARFRVHYEAALVVDTVVYDGIVDVIDALSGRYLLGVASNKPALFTRAIVEQLLPGRFAVVLGPEDVGAHKPDPRMLLQQGERLSAALVCHVGDSVVDVRAGKNAGVDVVGVSWGLGSRASLSDAVEVVDAPADIAAAVDRCAVRHEGRLRLAAI